MKVFGFLIILLIIFSVPVANAQISLGEKAEQKAVELAINADGSTHVKHIVGPSNLPKQLDLISGTISNILVTNEQGEEQEVMVVGDKNGVMVLPSQKNSIIEYDLDDAIVLKNNMWTLDYNYVETTNFLLPNKVDWVYLNGNPIYLGEKKGISCHSCQVTLEYSINKPSEIRQVNWEDKEFQVEIITFAGIENFDFDWVNKKISFEINKDNQYVTTIIPLELLWNPYVVFLNEEKIIDKEFVNNGTHIWVNMKPETSGEVSIIGTTVVPEFPIIAPLAIGFLMIMLLPFIRKFNLH